MRLHRLRQTRRVVAPFEHTDDAATGVLLSDGEDGLCQPSEVVHFQIQRTDGVFAMSVEPCTDEYKLRLRLCSDVGQGSLETSVVVGQRRAELHRNVGDHAETRTTAGLVGVPSPRIERPAMNREKSDAAVLPKNLLRT